MLIKFKPTTAEYKKGFKAAMKMILEWIEQDIDGDKSIDDLEQMLKGGLLLDDLMEKK